MQFGLKKTLRAACVVALTLAATTAARAEITTTISGFGTVGGSWTSDGNYTYHHDASEYTGAGGQFDIGLESRVGLQAKFDFGSGFSITAQELLRQRGNTQFDPGTEWLYAQYSPTSDLQFRVGRVVLPVFLFSDSRQVGFAAPWFRNAPEVYGQFPFNFVDGGQISYQRNLGPVTVALQGTFGSTSATFDSHGLSIESNAKDIINGSISLTYGDLMVRFAQTNLNIPNNLPLSPTFTLSYMEHETFLSAGGQYDNGKAVVIGEWAKTKQNNVPIFNEPLTGAWTYYLAAGWRFGKFLPLVTYGSVHNQKSLLADAYVKPAWSGTLRYDVLSNVALKAEVTRAGADNGAYFTDFDYSSHKKVNIYSLGADFVF